jgi:hypothetical protein
MCAAGPASGQQPSGFGVSTSSSLLKTQQKTAGACNQPANNDPIVAGLAPSVCCTFAHSSTPPFGQIASTSILFKRQHLASASIQQNSPFGGRQSTSSLFGGHQSTRSIFTPPCTSSSFGGPQSTGSLFGVQHSTGSLFGGHQSTGSIFTWPCTSSSFGGPQTTGFVFGGQQTTGSLFGCQQSTASLFGGHQSTESLFGGHKRTMFGTGGLGAERHNPFGGVLFDSNTSSTLFGASASWGGDSGIQATDRSAQLGRERDVCGSRAAPFVPQCIQTSSTDSSEQLRGICAVLENLQKSHEELRLKVDRANGKGNPGEQVCSSVIPSKVASGVPMCQFLARWLRVCLCVTNVQSAHPVAWEGCHCASMPR